MSEASVNPTSPLRRFSIESLFGSSADGVDDPRAIARMDFEEIKRLASEYQMDLGEVKQVLRCYDRAASVKIKWKIKCS